jgi:uncharacterized protein
VSSGRVGGVGLSVGGEMMLETAARTDALDALVSEGAGTRTFAEDVDEFGGVDKWLGMPFLVTKTAAVAVFSNTAPPPRLKQLVTEIEEPLMIIHNDRPGERVSHEYAQAADAQEWLVEGIGHTAASTARPAEYAQRVAGFFDEVLR